MRSLSSNNIYGSHNMMNSSINEAETGKILMTSSLSAASGLGNSAQQQQL